MVAIGIAELLGGVAGGGAAGDGEVGETAASLTLAFAWPAATARAFRVAHSFFVFWPVLYLAISSAIANSGALGTPIRCKFSRNFTLFYQSSCSSRRMRLIWFAPPRCRRHRFVSTASILPLLNYYFDWHDCFLKSIESL